LEDPVNWQLLARANTHPLRISILEVLALDGGRTLSPSELSYELDVALSNVNYHVTELARTGLLELAGERRVRGATEHFYCLATWNEPPDGRGLQKEIKRRKRTTGLEPATSSLGSSRSTS
jgi:DNA-binding transcriptional ArsR family regulator